MRVSVEGSALSETVSTHVPRAQGKQLEEGRKEPEDAEGRCELKLTCTR